MMRWMPGIIFLFSVLTLRSQDTLLLFHPTAYNLQLFMTLSSSGLLNLEGYHVLGVYHEQENYDYTESRAFLTDEGRDDYSLRSLNGPSEIDSLFCLNACSEVFWELFTCSRAAFFMGGPDIPPALYGKKMHLLTRVTDPYRHYLEISYLFHLLGSYEDPDWVPYLEQEPEYLVSGICLGMQGMNVATGGTLVQDIPTEIYGIWNLEDLLLFPDDRIHRNYRNMAGPMCTNATSYHFHRVHIEPGSFMAQDGSAGQIHPRVLSSHHQAVGIQGKGWQVAASSMDGKIIEALEHDKYPHVFGVQFHPEKPGLFDPEIVHLQTCSDSISFYQTITSAKGGSETFHREYWRNLGRILQLIRLR